MTDLFAGIIQSMAFGHSQEDSLRRSAIGKFKLHKDMVMSSAKNIVDFLQILFLFEDGDFIRRFISLKYPDLSFRIEFVEGPPHGTCICTCNKTKEMFFIFSKTSSHWLTRVVVVRWLPMLEIFANTLRNKSFFGEIVLNLHDEGSGVGLNYCDNQKTEYLIPDPEYVASRGYEAERYHFAASCVPWEQRSDRLFWRGSTTGRRTGGIFDLPRVRLCLLGQEESNKNHFDMFLTGFAQTSKEEESAIYEKGVMGEFVPSNRYCEYKYHIDIDGNTNAWSASFLKLLSGGLVFKVESPFGYRQWYYDRLEPWFHYVPIASDLHDLVEIFNMMHLDPERSQRIARQGQMLAQKIDFAGELNFATRRIQALSQPLLTHSRGSQPVFVNSAGDMASHPLASLVSNAFDRASLSDSKLTNTVLRMPGFNGKKLRHFLNNLIASVQSARYLEIGSYVGASACAAMERNGVILTCIDNWVQFGNPRDAFHQNIAEIEQEQAVIQVIDLDFRQVNFSNIGPFNVIYYSGPHDERDYQDFIRMIISAVDEYFVLIISDWNWRFVRDATGASISAQNLDVLYCLDIRTTNDDSHPEVCREFSDWHNGCCIQVVAKRNAGDL